MTDFDYPISAEDAQLQRALREECAGPAPDLGGRVAFASPEEEVRALARVDSARQLQRSRSRFLSAAAALVLGVSALGVTGVWLGDAPTEGLPERGSPKNRGEGSQLQAQDRPPRPRPPEKFRKVKNWAECGGVLKRVRTVEFLAGPVPNRPGDLGAELSEQHLTPGRTFAGELSAEARTALFRVLRNAKREDIEKDCDEGSFIGEFVFHLEDGSWFQVSRWPHSDGSDGGMLLLDSAQIVGVRLPPSVKNVVLEVAGRLGARWRKVFSDRQLSEVPDSVQTLITWNVSPEALCRALPRLKRLRQVTIRKAPTPALIRALAARPKLESVVFSGRYREELVPLDLSPFVQLKQLRRLTITGCELDPSDLARLPVLRKLSLCGCRLLDGGVPLVAKLRLETLHLLDLRGLQKSDLMILAELANVRELALSLDADDQVQPTLEAIQRLRALRHFCLIGPQALAREPLADYLKKSKIKFSIDFPRRRVR